jgi:hypothetical protein
MLEASKEKVGFFPRVDKRSFRMNIPFVRQTILGKDATGPLLSKVLVKRN